MSKVVLALEWGSNLGHVTRVAMVAEMLVGKGVDVTIITPQTGRAFVEEKGFSFVAAPSRTKGVRIEGGAASYAEVMVEGGYSSADVLDPLIRAWRSLISTHSPDLVVTDFAPTAVLAARDLDVPVLSMCTGFTLPPAGMTAPSFREGVDVSQRRLRNADRHVVDVIRTCTGSALAGRIDLASDVYLASDCVLTTMPEIDGYGTRLSVPYVGSLVAKDMHAPAEWRDDERSRVLVYARPGQPILKHLGELASTCQVMLAGPGLGHEEVMALEQAGVIVHSRPIDMESVLPRAQAFIHYGGLGSISSAIMAGVPSVVVPVFDEQMFNGMCVHRQQAGILVHPSIVSKMGRATRTVMEGEEYARNACRLRDANRVLSGDSPLNSVLDTIHKQLGVPSAGRSSAPLAGS